MAEGVSAEAIQGAVKALRYVLWHADRTDRVAAGVDPADMPPCPVADAELAALAAPLAVLVTVGRRAIAAQAGITDPAEQGRFARGQLEGELETHEMNAAFAGVEAEMKDAAGG